MGQVFAPSTGGINISTVDREAGPTAGAGASGNRCIFLGLSAGLNSTASDFIAIGNLAGSGGILTANGMDKTIVIGSGSLKAANISAVTTGSGIIALGSNILPSCQGKIGESIFIGNNVGQNLANTGLSNNNERNIVIGNNALQCSTFSGVLSNFTDNLIIGEHAGSNASGLGNAPVTNCIYLGNQAGSSSIAASHSSNIGIGVLCGPSGVAVTGVPSQNIYIGHSCISTSQVNSMGNILIGHSTSSAGLNNMLLGSNIFRSSDGCIIIGSNAGGTVAIPAGNGTVFIGNDAYGAMLYGLMTSGNLLVGNSAAADRQFRGTPGTNCLKLINGTVGSGANTVNGGYFYVTGGALHYVGSAGTDTTLAPA
jgi:hypothetical protein